ncbi:Mrp complex subunit E1, partial [Dysosmobacter welbionis]
RIELRDRGGHHRRGVRVRLLRRHLHPQGRSVPGDADRGLRQVREGSGSPEYPARRPAGLRAGGAAGRRRGSGRRHRHPQLRAPAPHHPHGPGAGERAAGHRHPRSGAVPVSGPGGHPHSGRQLPRRPCRRDHPLLAGRRGGHRRSGGGSGPVLRLQQH